MVDLPVLTTYGKWTDTVFCKIVWNGAVTIPKIIHQTGAFLLPSSKSTLDRCFINMRGFLFQRFFFQQPATEENDSLSNQMLLYDYIYVRRKETGYLKKNPV
ncbi:hypothetical protein CLOHYLEM_05077 [[Clostridium] hylemonae DSM 15053]|uniref:Uncharacterized protein n=1 Tax=[Clostridium] hylemonae DSM 15053 TaxID=553973 RepID=C0BZ38_9FIRM|nr:hypothetical protein CLOHYLEM_05077 [[Clostridium] hylemonae DSM 15053]